MSEHLDHCHSLPFAIPERLNSLITPAVRPLIASGLFIAGSIACSLDLSRVS